MSLANLRTDGNNGGGRRKGWIYLTTRPECERELSRLYNAIRAGQPHVTKRGKMVYRPADLEKVDRMITILKAVIDSKKFTESLSLKEVERELLRRIAEGEERLERFEELMRERGVPEDLLRPRNGGAQA